MCGRFTLQIPIEELKEIFALVEAPTAPFKPRYNIAPTQQIPIIRQYADCTNHLDSLRWGLIPSWAKEPQPAPLINARSETISVKPTFKHGIRYQRCLIPTSGFYEWKREGDHKTPMFIHFKDNSPMIFAGIWESWKAPEGQTIASCSILTTASNELIAQLHDRQPVIIHLSEFSNWLDRDMRDPEKLKHLYKPFPPETMEIYQVSTQVNNAKNEGPDLINPIS